MVAAAGCSTQQPADPQASSSTLTSASAAPAPPPTVSQFDARWMGVLPDQPQGWAELNRRITGDFQQFSLRPTDETEYRYGCNGCAPWKVDLTAYAPGKFDPAEARTGQPVTVNADGDGFWVEDQAKHTATLTWQYADDAWATAKGMTSATTELDRLVELAHALQPTQRTPIRLPLSMGNLPANMPLAEINVDTSPLQDDGLDYGTRLEFAPCGMAENGGVGDCRLGTDRMSVHIWPDDYRTPTGGLRTHHRSAERRRKGRPLRRTHPGGRSAGSTRHARRVRTLRTQLPRPARGFRRGSWPASVGLPDPGNDATWPAVTDWAK